MFVCTYLYAVLLSTDTIPAHWPILFSQPDDDDGDGGDGGEK